MGGGHEPRTRGGAADRRVAWLCRIDLLREAGRLTEALAWACLECELHPDNVAALAVKEELKRLSRVGGRPPAEPVSHGRAPLVRWQGLAGMRQLRAELEQDVISPLLDPELYRRYRIPLPNGILLYGPPGCGKTFIANKLAEIIGFRFFDISPADLGSIYVHGGQRLIRDLFKRAEAAAPAIIFFYGFDALAPARDDLLVALRVRHVARESIEIGVDGDRLGATAVPFGQQFDINAHLGPRHIHRVEPADRVGVLPVVADPPGSGSSQPAAASALTPPVRRFNRPLGYTES